MARSRDRSAIRDRMLARLRAAGFNSVSTGSLVRTLSDIWADDASQIIEDITFISSQNVVSSATGGFLDLIGQLLGIVRISPSQSSVSSQDQCIKFYCTTGVLSDYLPDSITEGFSEISNTVRVSDPTNQIVYQVERTLVPKGVTEVFVSAASVDAGTGSSVPAGVLTRHTIFDTNVKVTNLTSIETGTDLETDENFRYRISTAHTTMQAANETAIRLAALLTSGISDVKLFANAFGPGTFDALLIPEGNTVTQAQLDSARFNLQQASAFGMGVRVRAPDYLSINMVVHLTIQPGTADSRKDQAVSTARSQALAYIASVPIGGLFSPAIQERSIMQQDPVILKAEIILFCVDGVPQTISDYRLETSEMFVPNSTFVNPIEVVV